MIGVFSQTPPTTVSFCHEILALCLSLTAQSLGFIDGLYQIIGLNWLVQAHASTSTKKVIFGGHMCTI